MTSVPVAVASYTRIAAERVSDDTAWAAFLSDAYQDALGMDRINTGVPFHVHVTEGGAGVGTLQLHIFEMHIPADPGTVNSGNIVIQP